MRRKKVVVYNIEEHPCKVCGRMIPKPMTYCSSECSRNDKKDKQADLVKDFNFPEVPKQLRFRFSQKSL